MSADTSKVMQAQAALKQTSQVYLKHGEEPKRRLRASPPIDAMWLSHLQRRQTTNSDNNGGENIGIKTEWAGTDRPLYGFGQSLQ